MSAGLKFVILAAEVFKKIYEGAACSEVGHICLCCRDGDETILATACIRPGPDGWVAHGFFYREDRKKAAACDALLQKLLWYSVAIAARPHKLLSLAVCVGYNVIRDAAPGVRMIVPPRRRRGSMLDVRTVVDSGAAAPGS